MRLKRLPVGVAIGCVSVLAVTGCGGGGAAGDGATGTDGRVPVVASTNVWASVVGAVGGRHVNVTSVIDDPAADPHSYQAGAEDAADVQAAEVLVYNGGGYDDFFAQLAEHAPEAATIVATDLAGHGGDQGGASSPDHGGEHDGEGSGEHGHDHGGHEHDGHEHGGHDHGGGNEHVWYDLPVVAEVAEQVATRLGEAAPEHRKTFRDNAAAFTTRLDELAREIDRIAEEHRGASVVATEPIAHYLLTDAGLTDATPHDFAAAVENETDVPVAAQQQMLTLVAEGGVDAVVRNTQTVTPAVEKVVATARDAGVPVVDVTETLPEGVDDYIGWMSGQLDALAKALTN